MGEGWGLLPWQMQALLVVLTAVLATFGVMLIAAFVHAIGESLRESQRCQHWTREEDE